MSSRSLPMLRALIAMSMGDVLFPSVMIDRGYTDVIIEPDIRIGDGRTQPDLILVSQRAKHVVLWEAKESTEVARDQARLYAEVDAGVCEDQLQVPGARSDNYLVSTCYLTTDEYASWISDRLDDLGLAEHAVETEFRSQQPVVWLTTRASLGPLDDVFRRLEIEADEADPQLYPFDRSSSHRDVAPFLVNPLLEFASAGRMVFTASGARPPAH